MSSTSGPVAVLIGTRPEAIKLAPVVLALRDIGRSPLVITTGQHAGMVDEVLTLFGIAPDANLRLLRQGQSLDEMLSRALERVARLLDERQPSAVVVQGDTTSMLGSALAAFHHDVPVGHVEAGLRSHDMRMPFPEEMNRRAAATFATWHFAPTTGAAENLRREGVEDGVHVVGNTVVDAVRIVEPSRAKLPEPFSSFVGGAPYLLATAHRRESWGEGIAAIAGGLRDALRAAPDHRLIFVTHPNPAARTPVNEALGGESRAMVVDALPYADSSSFCAVPRLRSPTPVASRRRGPRWESPCS